MSKIPSSGKLLWLAIKQHDLTMIYINFITGAVVTELVPQGIWGRRLSHACVSHYRKMRTRRELEPKVPKPASPSALGPNSNSSQHPATVTFSPVDVHVETRWPPHPGCCLGHCPKSLQSRPRSTFLLWQLHYEFVPVRSTGASLMQSLMLQATPNPILPGPTPGTSISLLPPFQKAVLFWESTAVGLAVSPQTQ